MNHLTKLECITRITQLFTKDFALTGTDESTCDRREKALVFAVIEQLGCGGRLAEVTIVSSVLLLCTAVSCFSLHVVFDCLFLCRFVACLCNLFCFSVGCGTSWHAAGLVGRLKDSATVCAITNYSAQLYESLDREDHWTGTDNN